MKRICASAVAGFAITVFGFFAAQIGSGTAFGWVFFWQGHLLAYLIPAPNIGTPAQPFYEATPIHVLAYFMGIPVGIGLYASLTFVLLSLVDRNRVRKTESERLPKPGQ